MEELVTIKKLRDMRDYESIFWEYYDLQCKGGGKEEKDKIKISISNKIVNLMKENDKLKSKITE